MKNTKLENFIASMAKTVASELEKKSEFTLAHDIIEKNKLKLTKTKQTKTD